MKKTFIPLIAFLFTLFPGLSSHAQTIFMEKFESGIPAGFTIIDNDGNTPTSSIYTNAWVASTINVQGGIAISTSSYSPPGQSDDWMITPAISLGSGAFLKWKAGTGHYLKMDGYEVRISTTGTAIADFLANPILFSITNEANGWISRSLNLAALGYANQTVYIAFRNNSNDDLVLRVDDIEVVNTVPNDGAMANINVAQFVAIGPVTIKGRLTNAGYNTITSVETNWSVDNGTVTTQTSNVSMVPWAGYNFTHTATWTASTPGKHVLKVWISKINGAVDGNHINDTLETTIIVTSSNPQKHSMIEEFTGTWCGWCPRGGLVLEDAIKTPGIIGVSIHAISTSDPMAFDESDTINTYAVLGHPSGMVDRCLFSDQQVVNIYENLWKPKALERLQLATPAGINFTHTYNPTNRKLTVDVTTNFVAALQGDYRMNCYIVEDKITGGTAYDQKNYLYNTPGSPFYQVGIFYNGFWWMPGFVHNHVLRDIMNGPWGTSGTIPSTVNDGDSFTQQFSATLKPGWKTNDISIVAFISEYNAADITKRTIYNSLQKHLSDTTSTSVGELDKPFAQIQLYPQIVGQGEKVNISLSVKETSGISIKAYDVMGKEVAVIYDDIITGGNHQMVWDATNSKGNSLPAGYYLVSLALGNQVYSQKVIIH